MSLINLAFQGHHQYRFSDGITTVVRSIKRNSLSISFFDILHMN
jgi:hypothetical protein